MRLKDVIALNFDIMNKNVVTATKKIGKVTDYATEIETLYIQKIYVAQSIFKSFSGGNLGVDRSQIIEITPSRIVINDPLQATPAHVAATA